MPFVYQFVNIKKDQKIGIKYASTSHVGKGLFLMQTIHRCLQMNIKTDKENAVAKVTQG